MADLKLRLNHARLKLRRHSTPRVLSTGTATSAAKDSSTPQARHHARHPRANGSQASQKRSLQKFPDDDDNDAASREEAIDDLSIELAKSIDSSARSAPATETIRSRRQTESLTPPNDLRTSKTASFVSAEPGITIEQPTPEVVPVEPPDSEAAQQPAAAVDPDQPLPQTQDHLHPTNSRPPGGNVRRQSLVASTNVNLIKTLLDDTRPGSSGGTNDHMSFKSPVFNAGMLHRKIWVRRAGASPTLVTIREDDLVDDVREVILKKYLNSLGRSFDAPDISLHLIPRDHTQKGQDRALGPEEEICRTLDAYYPGGQTVDEALLIEIPRRTPRPSPRSLHHHHMAHFIEDTRPLENGTEYFPPMPAPSLSPNLPVHERAMSVMTTGQVPLLPSPGGTRRQHHSRPKYIRQHTVSPTTANPIQSAATSSTLISSRQSIRPRVDSSSSEPKHAAPPPPPLPTPPAPEAAPTSQKVTSPSPVLVSPRPLGEPKKRRRKPVNDTPTLSTGLLDGSVPPINCLIVEDNIINLKLLEAFMKRLKVRWQTAMNGRDAVVKWRRGGFHLVLMDIQLPIMSGLEATKEIRRLERVNNIGVFSSATASPTSAGFHNGMDDGEDLEGNKRGGAENSKKKAEDDRLGGDANHFKSPVIIVALTASSLQSDRHEALGVGCNDFLTKPVSFLWLERKVKEWGCMQALIDFDGWRKWKDFAGSGDGKDGKDKGQDRAHKRSGSYVPVSRTPAGHAAPQKKDEHSAGGLGSGKVEEQSTGDTDARKP